MNVYFHFENIDAAREAFNRGDDVAAFNLLHPDALAHARKDRKAFFGAVVREVEQMIFDERISAIPSVYESVPCVLDVQKWLPHFVAVTEITRPKMFSDHTPLWGGREMSCYAYSHGWDNANRAAIAHDAECLAAADVPVLIDSMQYVPRANLVGIDERKGGIIISDPDADAPTGYVRADHHDLGVRATIIVSTRIADAVTTISSRLKYTAARHTVAEFLK